MGKVAKVSDPVSEGMQNAIEFLAILNRLPDEAPVGEADTSQAGDPAARPLFGNEGWPEMNAPFLRPHGCPAGVDPVEWRKAVAARIEQMQDAMRVLIDALDVMDGDPDLEPEPLESSLGSSAVQLPDGTLADDAECDNSDNEYSLGWPVRHNQTVLSHAGRLENDLEWDVQSEPHDAG